MFCQCGSKRRSFWCCRNLGLTIHSSRTRFVASRLHPASRAGRLNSGVRPLKDGAMHLSWQRITGFCFSIAAMMSVVLVMPIVRETGNKVLGSAPRPTPQAAGTDARQRANPVEGITTYACRSAEIGHAAGETSVCYFRPARTLQGDFSSQRLRTERIRSDHAAFCSSIAILSDTSFQSDDRPPLYLRRVGFSCKTSDSLDPTLQPYRKTQEAILRNAAQQAAEDADHAVKR